MKRRKILSPEFDIEEERKRLLDEIPADTAPDVKSENEANINLNQDNEENK